MKILGCIGVGIASIALLAIVEAAAQNAPAAPNTVRETAHPVTRVAVEVATQVADRVATRVVERVATQVVTPIADRIADRVADNVEEMLYAGLDLDQDKRDTKDEKLQTREEKEERKAQRQEERARERALRAFEYKRDKGDQPSRLYDDGREALDEDHYERAEAKFDQLIQLNGSQTDAALYWKAYAASRLAKRDAALAAIADLKQRFPQSRWQKDAAALEIEVRQSSGQQTRPEGQNDDELRLLALQGLVRSDPERAMPVLGKVLEGAGSPKEKGRALFVLAQSGSPQAREILVKIARGQGNPDLQRKAIQYLGIFGGAQAGQTLAEVYASPSTDASVRRAILRSYMITRDKERLFQAAKGEKDDDLKREAIRQLGIMHAQNELQQLYRTDNSPAVRRELVQAFFLAGDAPKLLEVAQSDEDPELRRKAIHTLGLIHSDDASKALQSIYAKDTDRGVKEAVLQAYFVQGNAGAIVAIARSEKDPDLKKAAVSKLSIMHSKEATDYLMELLQK
jgi:TolA-binding protein